MTFKGLHGLALTYLKELLSLHTSWSFQAAPVGCPPPPIEGSSFTITEPVLFYL